MKKLILFILVILTLASCSTEYLCHAYGNTNRTTKYGSKAQAHYGKHKHRI